MGRHRRHVGRRSRRCPHTTIHGIYGDAINHYGARLVCADCGRLLDGPVSLAGTRPGG